MYPACILSLARTRVVYDSLIEQFRCQPQTMTSPQMTDPSAWPSWPYIFAYALPIWMIGVFITSLSTSASHALLVQVGFPQPRDKPLNIFWYMFAVRELLFGLILLILEREGEWKAVSIIIGVMTIGGSLDVVFSATKGGVGWIEGFKAHGIVTMVALFASYQIWMENK